MSNTYTLKEAVDIVRDHRDKVSAIFDKVVKDITKEEFDYLNSMKNFTKPAVENSKTDDSADMDTFNNAYVTLTTDITKYFASSTIKSAVKTVVANKMTSAVGNYRYMVNFQIMKLPKKNGSFKRNKDNYMRIDNKGSNTDRLADIVANNLCDPIIGGFDMGKVCGTLEELAISHYIERMRKTNSSRPIYESLDDMVLKYKLNAIKAFVDDKIAELFINTPSSQTIHFKSIYAEEARRLYFTLLRMEYVSYPNAKTGVYKFVRAVPVKAEDGVIKYKDESKSLSYKQEGSDEVISLLTKFFADTYTSYLEYRDFLAHSPSSKPGGRGSTLSMKSAPVYNNFNTILYKTEGAYTIFGCMSHDIVNPYLIFDNFVADRILTIKEKYNWDVRIHSDSEYSLRTEDGEFLRFNGVISDAHLQLFEVSDGLVKWKKNELGVRAVYPNGEGIFVIPTKSICALIGIHYHKSIPKFFAQLLRRALPYNEGETSFVYIPPVQGEDSIIDLYNGALAETASYSVEDDLALEYTYGSQKELDSALYAFFSFLQPDDYKDNLELVKSFYQPQSTGKRLAIMLDKSRKFSNIGIEVYADNLDEKVDNFLTYYVSRYVN